MAVSTVTTTITYEQDINTPVQIKPFRSPLSKGDAKAHTFIVEVTEDGESYDLTGATCTGAFINKNGATTTLTGTVEGNKASITLTSPCYELPGQCVIVMRLNKGGEIRTLLWLRGIVAVNETDTIYDPSDEMSIATIQAIIADCETATARANNSVGTVFSTNKEVSSGTSTSITVNTQFPSTRTPFVAALTTTGTVTLTEASLGWQDGDLWVEIPAETLPNVKAWSYKSYADSSVASIMASVKYTGTGSITFAVAYGSEAGNIRSEVAAINLEDMVSVSGTCLVIKA